MRSELNASQAPQEWIADRWIKHSDSVSIAKLFAHRSTWNRLSLADDGRNVVAMQSLAGALANEGVPQWIDATRLAWRMAVTDGCQRSLFDICVNLSQLGHDPLLTPEFHAFRERCFKLAIALAKASRWTVGEHVSNAAWARVLRNMGDLEGFARVASELDKPRVLREMLGGEADPVQRFRVVQALALNELERSSGASRLDWMLGLLVEIGTDIDAGSTAMRVLLVESELAVRQGDMNVAFVGALQLTNHMINGDSELCSRADLACLLRSVTKAFSSSAPIDHLSILACQDLSPRVPNSVQQIESLARDMDRISEGLPTGLRVSLPRLAGRQENPLSSQTGVVLPFSPSS